MIMKMMMNDYDDDNDHDGDDDKEEDNRNEFNKFVYEIQYKDSCICNQLSD